MASSQKAAVNETEAIRLTAVLPATPERVYRAWLNGAEHSAMTGGEATVDARVGGAFTAWDGYITGTTLELEPGKRIVQAWRTSEFPKRAADSRLEVLLEPAANGGTKLTLVHTGIPKGQGKNYESGWPENYFEPMTEYFATKA